MRKFDIDILAANVGNNEFCSVVLDISGQKILIWYNIDSGLIADNDADTIIGRHAGIDINDLTKLVATHVEALRVLRS